jgi:hypothetical protein
MACLTLRKIWGIILLGFVLLLGTDNRVGSQPVSKSEEVFAIISLNNPGQLIKDIGQLVESIQPGMGVLVNSAVVGQAIFKNPTWAGMDMGGKYLAVILNPQKYSQSPYAITIPLTHRAGYLATLSQSLKKEKEEGGIYTFKEPASEKRVFVTFTRKVAILSENKEVARQVKELVEKNNPALKSTPLVKGAITASVPVSKILTTFQPMIEAMKQQMLMGLEKQTRPPQQEESKDQASQTPLQAEAVKKILQTEVDLVLSILGQIETLDLGINVKAEGLRISQSILSVKGSNVANFINLQSPQKSSLLGFIPSDAGIIGSISLKVTPEIIQGYIDFLKIIYGATPGVDPGTIDHLSQWITEFFKAFGEELAFGLSTADEKPLMIYLYNVQNPPKARQLMEEYPQLLAPMMNFYKSTGTEFDVKISDKINYHSGEILIYKMNLKTGATTDPEAQEAFTKLFGKEMSMPVGFIGQYSVMGFGPEALGEVQKLMDLLNSSTKISAKHTPSLFGLPEENNIFLYFSIPRLVAWAASLDPKVPNIKVQESPGIALSGRFAESRIETEFFIPAKEISVFRDMIPVQKAPQPQ